MFGFQGWQEKVASLLFVAFLEELCLGVCVKVDSYQVFEIFIGKRKSNVKRTVSTGKILARCYKNASVCIQKPAEVENTQQEELKRICVIYRKRREDGRQGNIIEHVCFQGLVPRFARSVVLEAASERWELQGLPRPERRIDNKCLCTCKYMYTHSLIGNF